MRLVQICKTSAGVAFFVMAASVFAATNAKGDYASTKDRISAEYKADKEACSSYNGNTKDVCIEQAKAKEKVARAELEYNYTGRPADEQKLAVAKADSAYAVSKEMCGDKGGNSKSDCVGEAKATHVKALAEAKIKGN